MARVFTIEIKLGAPDDTTFTLLDLVEMIKANLVEWDFDVVQLVRVLEDKE